MGLAVEAGSFGEPVDDLVGIRGPTALVVVDHAAEDPRTVEMRALDSALDRGRRGQAADRSESAFRAVWGHGRVPAPWGPRAVGGQDTGPGREGVGPIQGRATQAGAVVPWCRREDGTDRLVAWSTSRVCADES